MSTFAICRCCNLVQQQIQILQWKSRFSNGCVIHVKESVVFLVLSANVPALWAPVRKPVLFWPSWCGCSNGTTNPKKQYHYNVMHCWCWMITRSSPSHDYILRFFFFFVLLQFPVLFTAVHDTSKRLSQTLRDIYESDWNGVQDLSVITEVCSWSVCVSIGLKSDLRADHLIKSVSFQQVRDFSKKPSFIKQV